MSYHTVLLASGQEEYGIGSVLTNLTVGLQKRNRQACIAALAPGPFVETCRHLNIDCHLLSNHPHTRYQGSGMRRLFTMAKLSRHRSRQAIHLSQLLKQLCAKRIVSQWPLHLPISGKAAQLSGAMPYWLMPNRVGNRWPFGLNGRYFRWLCDQYNVIPLANSNFTRNSLGPFPAARTLYLGIDHHRFDPDRLSERPPLQISIPPDAIVLGMVSAVRSSKGHHLVLQALLETRSPRPLHLLVVGGPTDSDYASQLKKMASQNGVADRLHLVGFSEKPEQYYPAMDLAVNFYTGAEAFGLSVVEAMAMRKPVIVHALGGPAETVLDGQTGWHVPSPTVPAFKTALQRALSDQTRWTAMGIQARERVLQNFTTDRFVENYLAFTEA